MTVPTVPSGWTRLLVKSKFAIGRDFRVLDPDTDEQRYLVDGKIVPLAAHAEVQDSFGNVIYRIRSRPFDLAKQMHITDASGDEVATLRAKRFSPIRERMTLTMAAGGTWELEGSFIEKDYTISSAGRTVATISQKWLSIRDTYSVDVSSGTDPGLVLAVLWAVDHWVEQRG